MIAVYLAVRYVFIYFLFVHTTPIPQQVTDGSWNIKKFPYILNCFQIIKLLSSILTCAIYEPEIPLCPTMDGHKTDKIKEHFLLKYL